MPQQSSHVQSSVGTEAIAPTVTDRPETKAHRKSPNRYTRPKTAPAQERHQQRRKSKPEHAQTNSGSGSGSGGGSASSPHQNFLVLEAHISTIVELSARHEVTIVSASTGSGKSTLVPGAVAEANPGKRVWVAVPTVAAAKSVCKYGSGKYPHIKCGWAAGGICNYNSDTQVIYCTTGRIKQNILHNNFDRICDFLMVDEVHGSDVDTIMLVHMCHAALRDRKKWRAPNLKVILSSATIDVTAWDHLFDDIGVFQMENRGHPIKVEYNDRDYALDDERDLIQDTLAKIVELHMDPATGQANFLVFVDGADKVEDFIQKLYQNPKTANDCVVLPAYARLSRSELDEIFEPLSTLKVKYNDQGYQVRRKIVIATNVAESAITIPGEANSGATGGIGMIVIDTCRCKVLEAGVNNNNCLSTSITTQAESNQRKGRAGRTEPGLCYRMCTEDGFVSFKKHREPEHLRILLYEQVLELFAFGFDPKSILEIPTKKYKVTIKNLAQRKLIVPNASDTPGYDVTELGLFVTKWPTSIDMALIIHQFKDDARLLFCAMVVVALIDARSSGNLFYIPRRHRGQTQQEYQEFLLQYMDRFSRFKGECDLDQALKIYYAMEHETRLLMKDRRGYQTKLYHEFQIRDTIFQYEPERFVAGKVPYRAYVDWSKYNSINNKTRSKIVSGLFNLQKVACGMNLKYIMGTLEESQALLAKMRHGIVAVLPFNVYESSGRNFFANSTTGENRFKIDRRGSGYDVGRFGYGDEVIALVRADIKGFDQLTGCQFLNKFISMTFPIPEENFFTVASGGGGVTGADAADDTVEEDPEFPSLVPTNGH